VGTPFYARDKRLLDDKKTPTSYKTKDEFFNATHLGCVVKKLIDIGAIYKVFESEGNGYFLQA